MSIPQTPAVPRRARAYYTYDVVPLDGSPASVLRLHLDAMDRPVPREVSWRTRDGRGGVVHLLFEGVEQLAGVLREADGTAVPFRAGLSGAEYAERTEPVPGWVAVHHAGTGGEHGFDRVLSLGVAYGDEAADLAELAWRDAGDGRYAVVFAGDGGFTGVHARGASVGPYTGVRVTGPLDLPTTACEDPAGLMSKVYGPPGEGAHDVYAGLIDAPDGELLFHDPAHLDSTGNRVPPGSHPLVLRLRAFEADDGDGDGADCGFAVEKALVIVDPAGLAAHPVRGHTGHRITAFSGLVEVGSYAHVPEGFRRDAVAAAVPRWVNEDTSENFGNTVVPYLDGAGAPPDEDSDAYAAGWCRTRADAYLGATAVVFLAACDESGSMFEITDPRDGRVLAVLAEFGWDE